MQLNQHVLPTLPRPSAYSGKVCSAKVFNLELHLDNLGYNAYVIYQRNLNQPIFSGLLGTSWLLGVAREEFHSVMSG